MGLAKTLIHVLGIGPLFLYIGIQRDQVPEYIFQFLGIVGLLILIYHSVRAFAALQENKSAWINWIHIFSDCTASTFVGIYEKRRESSLF